MELRCVFWKLGLAGEEKKVSVANGAIRVLSLSIVNNKTEQQQRTPGIRRKGNPWIPCNPMLHSATVLELQGFSLNSFWVWREKKGGKEGGWGRKKKKKRPLH